jgi:hypothetical protein
LVSEVALIHQYDPNEREARERVQARLALMSLIIWFVASFGAAALLVPRYGARAPLVLAIGFGALVVAAVFSGLKCSSSRHPPTMSGIWSRNALKPSVKSQSAWRSDQLMNHDWRHFLQLQRLVCCFIGCFQWISRGPHQRLMRLT